VSQVYCCPIQGHDVEEFIAVTEWFGGGALDGSVARLAAAAARPPIAGRADITGACGTCLRLAA
jgi:hypothetical protein